MRILDFYCLQPIFINNSVKKTLDNREFEPKGEFWNHVTDTEKKVSTHYIENSMGQGHHCLEISSENISEENLFKEKLSASLVKIDSSFTLNHATATLIYNRNFKCFYLIVLLRINMDDSIFTDEKIAVYEYIRDLLVEDDVQGKTISPWVKFIKEKTLHSVKLCFPKKAHTVSVLPNTGYVIAHSEQKITSLSKSILNKFIFRNHSIDLIDEMSGSFSNLSICKHSNYEKKTDEINNTVIFLGWRFSTVIGLNSDVFNKLFEVLEKVQLIYFEMENIYKPQLHELYTLVRRNDDRLLLQKHLEKYDSLNISFQDLMLEKHAFESTIKPYQKEVFDLMEYYWQMKNDYLKLDKTFQICQNSLDRKLSLKNNKIQQKQSDILFILVSIQIFSVLSLFLDYSTLYQLPDDKNSVLLIFSSTKDLLVALLSFSTGLLLFAYYEKIASSVKTFLTKIQ